MPAFSVTPLTDVPPPQAADFPDFIQFQAAGTDLGLSDADTLNFSTGLTATRGTGENSNVVTVEYTGTAAPALQIQEDGVNLGAANVDTLNFSTGILASRGSDNTVTITVSSAGGASYGLIELTTPPDPGFVFFDGALFNRWTVNTVIANADWSFDTGFLQFLTAGVYRVIATCMIEASLGTWPDGNSLYGSQIDTIASEHGRYQVQYDSTELTALVRWTDQHVVQIATANTTVECALFALSSLTTYAIAGLSMTLVIERLGDYPV